MASHSIKTRHNLHAVAIKLFECLYSQREKNVMYPAGKRRVKGRFDFHFVFHHHYAFIILNTLIETGQTRYLVACIQNTRILNNVLVDGLF